MKKILLIAILQFTVFINTNSQPLCGTKKEQSVIRENYASMRFYTDIAVEDAFEKMKAEYKFPQREESTLKKLFHDREWRKSAYDFVYEDAAERVKAKQKIDSIYLDSINSILLFHNRLSGRSITLALKMSKAFKLSNGKYDYLMKKALVFARRFLKDRHDSFKREEIDALQKVLSHKQVEMVLNEKNRFEAAFRVQKAWDALEAEKLTEQLDSANDTYRAQKYYSNEMLIGDLYVGKQELLENNYRELQKYKPSLVKMYEALEQKKAVKKTKKEKSIGAQYVW